MTDTDIAVDFRLPPRLAMVLRLGLEQIAQRDDPDARTLAQLFADIETVTTFVVLPATACWLGEHLADIVVAARRHPDWDPRWAQTIRAGLRLAARLRAQGVACQWGEGAKFDQARVAS